MFKVRYIYSACIVIETDDVKILCDPWFSEGIYDGSWYHFPEVENPIKKIGDVDVIYVSHIHPDHYDPVFLKQYFQAYGKKRIVIPEFKSNYLKKKMEFDGLSPDCLVKDTIGGTTFAIFPNATDSASDIDSALLVSQKGLGFLNLNDCIWNEDHSKQILQTIEENKLDLRLIALGYAGAGPYPQTYYDEEEILLSLAEKKKEEFFNRYRRNTDFFKAKAHLPFAGKYILGSRLAKMNRFRGVPDSLEVLGFDPKAFVLDDGGDAFYDLEGQSASRLRQEKYSLKSLEMREKSLSTLPLKYETDLHFKPEEYGFQRLITISYGNALRKSEIHRDYYFVFNLIDQSGHVYDRYFVNARAGSKTLGHGNDALDPHTPRSEIHIDYRYFFGLLTGLYHWNNAEVGSLFQTRRFPDIYDRSAQRFLNFFSI